MNRKIEPLEPDGAVKIQKPSHIIGKQKWPKWSPAAKEELHELPEGKKRKTL